MIDDEIYALKRINCVQNKNLSRINFQLKENN